MRVFWTIVGLFIRHLLRESTSSGSTSKVRNGQSTLRMEFSWTPGELPRQSGWLGTRHVARPGTCETIKENRGYVSESQSATDDRACCDPQYCGGASPRDTVRTGCQTYVRRGERAIPQSRGIQAMEGRERILIGEKKGVQGSVTRRRTT